MINTGKVSHHFLKTYPANKIMIRCWSVWNNSYVLVRKCRNSSENKFRNLRILGDFVICAHLTFFWHLNFDI